MRRLLGFGVLFIVACDGCTEEDDGTGGATSSSTTTNVGSTTSVTGGAAGGGGEGPIQLTGGGGAGGVSCSGTLADCDGDPSNGCESDTAVDPANCGACGDPCAEGTCAGSVCQTAEVLASGIPTVAHITTDGSTLYFASGGHASQLYFDAHVMSLPVDGGEPPTVLAGPYPSVEAVALDGTDVLFSSVGTQAGDAMDGFVGRVAKVGGAVDVFAPAQPYANQIIVDSGNFYWPTAGTWSGNFVNGTIRRSEAGAAPVTLVDPEVVPTRVVVDSGYVYWNSTGTPAAMYADGAIRRINLSGGSVETIVDGVEHASAFAVASGVIYFGSHGAVSIVDPSSPGVVQPFAVAHDNVATMIVDAPFLYWTEAGSMGRVVRQELSGGSETVLASNLNAPYGITVDSTYVYWTVRGTGVDDGAVMRIAK